MRQFVVCAALLCALTITGCASKEKKAERPAELAKLSNRFQVTRAWSVNIGGEQPKLRLGLRPAIAGNRVFAANFKGELEAFDLASGRRLWQRQLRAPLSGGPGAGEDLVVVGADKGQVIALSQSDGAERWHVRINSEILAAPAVGRDVVVVRAVDGRLHIFNIKDGSEQWVVEQSVPRLSLRGTSAPIIAGDLAVCGFDNGRVIGVSLNNGSTAWEAAVGQSRGSTELQRLIDVDADVVADGDDLYAAAYQGRVAHLARETGQISWGHELSTYRGLAIDAAAVYVTTADGDVVRLDRSTGAEQWRQKALARRMLSAPAVYGGRVVVADLDGYVHWLDAATGNIVARVRAGKRISEAPVVAGDLLLTFSDAGVLSAFRAPSAGG